MIRKITIENFKSIEKLDLELGRVNVLIGENGCGKTNILEAIAFGFAAARDKLGNEYLVPRGVRITDPRFMRSAFPDGDIHGPVVVSLQNQGEPPLHIAIDPERRTLSSPLQGAALANPEAFLNRVYAGEPAEVRERRISEVLGLEPLLRDMIIFTLQSKTLPDFIIYAPENSVLRIPRVEPRIFPLGIRGEGLFAHLKALGDREDADRLAAIDDRLALLDWFERIEIPKDLAPEERRIMIRDRYLADGTLFDQRSANEGFLLLLFYFTLFISPDTPAFFAIDNVDTSLNPKLCAELLRQIVELTEEHKKQVILTTHNPALLDGLNLHDDEQRLIAVGRDIDGRTKVHRVGPPKPLKGHTPVSLSEAFMRGYIGGLPKNF